MICLTRPWCNVLDQEHGLGPVTWNTGAMGRTNRQAGGSENNKSEKDGERETKLHFLYSPVLPESFNMDPVRSDTCSLPWIDDKVYGYPSVWK